MNKYFLLLISIAICFTGSVIQCSKDMAGDVTETGNATVAGIVTNKSGENMAGAEVFLYCLDCKYPGPVTAGDTFYTDAEGKFNISLEAARYCLGLHNREDEIAGMTMPFELDTGDVLDLGNLVLEPYVEYKGIILQTHLNIKRVVFGGTPYTAHVDNLGNFTIKKIPRRIYSVLIEIDVSGKLEYIPVKNIDLSFGSINRKDTLSLQPETIILDDFEDEDNRNRLGLLFGGGWWDAQSDAFVGGNSELLQPWNASPYVFADAIKNGGPGHKKSLQVIYELGNKAGEERDYPFIYVSMEIGNGFYNLMEFDSIGFSAKGDGAIFFEFQQAFSEIKISAGVNVKLTGEWQNIIVKPEDLSVEVFQFPENIEDFADVLQEHGLPQYSDEPENWDEMGGIVNYIYFLGIEGAEFWIDDIKLYGIGLKDMLDVMYYSYIR